MDLLQAISALMHEGTTAEASPSVPSGEPAVFMQLLEAAVRGGAVEGANAGTRGARSAMPAAAAAYGAGAPEAWPVLVDDALYVASNEVQARLIQLDALLGLRLAAQSLPGRTEAPPPEGVFEEAAAPRLPREVIQVVRQLVGSGTRLPETMRLALKLDQGLANLVTAGAAGGPNADPLDPAEATEPPRAAPHLAPSLTEVDRAIAALLRQPPTGLALEVESGAPSTERLDFGRFFATVRDVVETGLADQPEPLHSARALLGALRSQYMEPQAFATAMQAREPNLGGPPAVVVAEPRTSLEVGTFAPPGPSPAAPETQAPMVNHQAPADPSAQVPLASFGPPDPGPVELAPTGRWALEPVCEAPARWAPPESGEGRAPVPESAPAPAEPARPMEAQAEGRLASALWDRLAQAQANAARSSGVASGGWEAGKTKEIPPVIRVGSAQFVTREAEVAVSPGTRSAFALGDVSGETARQVATVAQAIDRRANAVRMGFDAPAPSVAGRANGVPTAWVAPTPHVQTVGDRQPGVAPLLLGRDAPSDPAAEILTQLGASAGALPTATSSPAAAPGVPAGIDRSALLEQLAESIRASNHTGRRSEIVLRLRPEHLGDIRVTVSVSDGIVSARLTVQSPAVRSALESEMGLLRQTLADAGLSVDSLQVSVSDQGAQQFVPQRDREFYSGAYRRFQASGLGMGEADELMSAMGAGGAGVLHTGALSLLA